MLNLFKRPHLFIVNCHFKQYIFLKNLEKFGRNSICNLIYKITNNILFTLSVN